MADADLGGRLPLLPPTALGPDAKALYDRLVGGRSGAAPFRATSDAGALIGPFNAIIHAPDIGAGFLAFHEAEERATPLSARVREVVILSVGAVWQSAYELYAHRAVAAQAGFSADVVAALAAGEASDQLDERERAAQDFTLELVRTRSVADPTYAAAERLLGHDGVVAMTFLAAAYTGTCMVLNAFAVPAPGAD